MKKLSLALAVLAVFSAFQFPIAADADKAFMIKAAQSNLAEIEAAKLAVSKSSSDSVKAYAQMMIDDHTMAQSELAALAQSQGVTLPDSTDVEHRIFKQRLMLVSGGTFDSAYVQSQVKDHIKAVTLFKTEVANGRNPQDKAYATKMLPKLQMHLQHAQGMAGGAGMNMQ